MMILKLTGRFPYSKNGAKSTFEATVRADAISAVFRGSDPLGEDQSGCSVVTTGGQPMGVEEDYEVVVEAWMRAVDGELVTLKDRPVFDHGQRMSADES